MITIDIIADSPPGLIVTHFQSTFPPVLSTLNSEISILAHCAVCFIICKRPKRIANHFTLARVIAHWKDWISSFSLRFMANKHYVYTSRYEVVTPCIFTVTYYKQIIKCKSVHTYTLANDMGILEVTTFNINKRLVKWALENTWFIAKASNVCDDRVTLTISIQLSTTNSTCRTGEMTCKSQNAEVQHGILVKMPKVKNRNRTHTTHITSTISLCNMIPIVSAPINNYCVLTQGKTAMNTDFDEVNGACLHIAKVRVSP